MRLFFIALWAFSASVANAHSYEVTGVDFVDADTFQGSLNFGFGYGAPDRRFRLMCIDAPESRGRDKSEAGVALSVEVQEIAIESGVVEIYKVDSFGRFLVYFRPRGWDMTLNKWLYLKGAPLYDKLTRAERAECLERLEE